MDKSATEIDLESRQTELVYEKVVTGAVFGVLVAVVLAISSYLVESGLRGFFWLSCALAVFAGFVVLADRYYRDANRIANSPLWQRRILILTFVCGCIWGGAAWALFAQEDVVFKFFLYTVLAAVAAVSVSLFSARFILFAAFSIPLLGLVAVEAVLQGGIFLVFGGFIVLLAVTLIKLSLTYHSDIIAMCHLDTQNSGLLEKVEQLSETTSVAAENEALALAVLEDAGVYLWQSDNNSRITEASQRFLELAGFQSSELEGMSLLDLLLPDTVGRAGSSELDLALSQRKGFRDIHCSVHGKNTSPLLVQVTARPLKTENGDFVGFEGYFRDVTVSRTVVKQLTFQNQHDPLTGLINRTEFLQRLSVFVPPLNLRAKVPHVIYIDIRNLILVNDTLGLAAGDKMFVELAEVLTASAGSDASISRLGGGAFGVLLQPGELGDALQAASLAIEALNAYRYVENDLTFSVQARAGIAGVTPRMETPEVVLNCAHSACRSLEENEVNSIGVYRSDNDAATKDNPGSSLAELISSLENRSLCLRYQPVRNIDSGEAVWLEALLARKESDGRVNLVGQRLGEALKHGVVLRFDRWVVDSVLREISGVKSGVDCGIVVNLSAPSMLDRQLPNYIFERLKKYGVEPERLCFDITIGDEISDFQLAADNMQRLVTAGCKLSLDDFATAACSLESLKHLPASFVKINHVYLENLATDATDQLVCQSIVKLAHSKNCEVIAESVQDKTIVPLLKELGITLAQGYALGEPARLSEACGSKVRSADTEDFARSRHSRASNVVSLPNVTRRGSIG